MLIKNKSILTSKTHEMDINITEGQLIEYLNGDGLIQNIMPNINADEREFIMNGITPQEWKDKFGEDEE